jgi:hypothetical protein
VGGGAFALNPSVIRGFSGAMQNAKEVARKAVKQYPNDE